MAIQEKPELTLRTYEGHLLGLHAINECNAYVDLKEINSYAAGHSSNNNWFNEADETVLVAAVISATRIIGAEYMPGSKTSLAQSLVWPRTDVYNPDADNIIFYTGLAQSTFSNIQQFDYRYIPQFIKDVACEIAIDLLVNNRFAGLETSHTNNISLGGKISISTAPNTQDTMNSIAREMLERVVSYNDETSGSTF